MSGWRAVLPLAATAATAALGVRGLRPSKAKGTDAQPGEVSAERARRHLLAIAAQPRPSGSTGADKAREYVMAELRDLGFDVQVHESTGVGDLGPTPYGPRYRTGGRVRSVVAHLSGYQPGHSVLLMTHYDSVGQGPGASDAATPVAALLEATRAVLADGTPRNDLLVVMTDGEEAGLLGAQAFFAEHPLAEGVGVALNFEARGTCGPALMFEAGPGNGPLVRLLADCGVPVFASSLFDEVYRHLPNATDFTCPKERGLPGLNFANVAGFVRYHGPRDDVDHADRNTLQHHGELAAALLRKLGDIDLTSLTGGDDVFFSVGRGRVVRYPVGAVPALNALAVAATAWSVWRSGTGLPRLGKDLAALLGRLGAAAGGATALSWAAGKARPEFHRSGDFHDADLLYTALCCGTGAAALLGTPPRARGRALAASLPLAAGAVASALRLPGASYLTTWPLLASAASPLTGAVTAAALFAPLSRLLFDGLTPRLSGSAAVALQVVAELAAPAFGTAPWPVRRIAGVAAAVAGAAAVARLVTRRPDAERPAPDTLSYLLDADTGEALWVSSDPATTEWTARALGDRPRRGRLDEHFGGWRRDFLQADAPVVDLLAPQAIVMADRREHGRRLVRLLVISPRGARQVRLAVLGEQVLSWSVDGRSGDTEPDGNWELWLHAVPEEGLVVEVETADTELRLSLADRDDGLPGPLLRSLLTAGPRPESSCDTAALDVETWGNASIVTRSVRL